MYTIYQVEYGDTIDIIAKKTNSTPEIIKDINGFNNDFDIVVGSLIVVPKMQNQLFETYTVKAGDSIYSIAREYNVDPNMLLALNGLNKGDYIYPNQQITIPSDNLEIYITREGDTLNKILNNLGIDANTFTRENDKIFVLEDQLVIHKKEGNM